MNRSFFLLLALFLATACSTVAPLRVGQPVGAHEPPVITELEDLGALPWNGEDELSRANRDGRFSPGEWVVVHGRGLAAAAVQVRIDGAPVTVEEHIAGGGLLVRVPRESSALGAHWLEVQTPLGRTRRQWNVTRHVAISDTRANRLRFLRLDPSTEPTFDEAGSLDISLVRVRDHVFSTDGGLVYAAYGAGKSTETEPERTFGVAVVHVGAADGPALVRTVPLVLKEHPVAVALAPDGSRLFVLGRAELVSLDLTARLSPREVGRWSWESSEVEPFGLALLDGGKRATILDRKQNALWLVNVEAPVPELIQRLPLDPQAVPRASIQLAADLSNDRALWVLQGPHFDRVAEKLRGVGGKVGSLIDQGKEAVGLKRSSEPSTKADEAIAPEVGARLLRVALESDRLVVRRLLPLGEYLSPLCVRSTQDGSLLVGGVGFGPVGLSELDASIAGGKALLAQLRRNLWFGRIIEVSASGEISELADGAVVPMTVDRLPNGALIHSSLRLAASFGSYVAVGWGVEAMHQQRVRLRKLRWTSLIPPHSFPVMSVQ